MVKIIGELTEEELLGMLEHMVKKYYDKTDEPIYIDGDLPKDEYLRAMHELLERL